MKCEEFENLISEFLDGALPSGSAGAFKAHRLECPDCRGLLEDVTSAMRMCAEEAELDAPLGILSKALVIPALYPPIDCDRCQDLITEFLDGYLEPGVYHSFETHLNACADCSETIAGVALAVSACHSVHFSENLEVPESLVSRILCETSGQGFTAKSTAASGVWGRLHRLFGFGGMPVGSQRFATASLIVVVMYGVFAANGGSLRPDSLYKDAARLSAKVYSKSSHLASETGEVFAEVDRIKAQVDDLFVDEPKNEDDTAPSPATEELRESRGRQTANVG